MNMMSLSPWWWLLLPVLGLPLWWHRQRRLTQKMSTLATAKFLPASPPQLLKVWRWRDRLLLLLRCLILVTMVAILASIVVPWRGDTVFVASRVNTQELEKLVRELGFTKAARATFCTGQTCDISTDNMLFWLEQHQSQWQAGARWLIVAPAGALSMNGTKPNLRHDLIMRVAPPEVATLPETPTVTIAINSPRMAEWRHLFSAFEAAGVGSLKVVLSEKYDARASLVIWDQPSPRDPEWRAPLIWQTISSVLPAQTGESLSNADLQSLYIEVKLQDGRQIWTANTAHDWPLKRSDDAKKLYEAWRSVYPNVVPMQEQMLKADTSSYLSLSGTDTLLQNMLVGMLLILFALERSLAHVRRA